MREHWHKKKKKKRSEKKKKKIKTDRLIIGLAGNRMRSINKKDVRKKIRKRNSQ